MRASGRARLAAACALTLANLWVCATAMGAVTDVPLPSTLESAGAIDVNAAGDLVVLDRFSDRVHVLTPEGGVVRVFTANPPGNPADLAVGDHDSIYVLAGGQVKRYSSAGVAERPIGSLDEGDPAYLAGPRGVAAVADGGVYVLDTRPGASSVVRFGADGSYLGRWAVVASSGAPVEAVGIAARGETVAVMRAPTESAPGEVIRYDTAGAEVNRWALSPSPSTAWGYPNPVNALALGDGGGVFAAGGSVVRQFDTAGLLRAIHDHAQQPPLAGEPYGSCLPAPTVRVPWPAAATPAIAGIARDARGVTYATDSSYRRLVKLDTRPEVAVDWAPQGAWGGDANPRTGQKVVFSAGRSRLPLGWLTKFEWDFDGDGTYELDTGTGRQASVHYGTPGARDVHVKVTGSGGAAAIATVPLTVAGSVAQVFAPSLGLTGRPVRFDASRSFVPCGTVEKYEWDLDGDGSFERDTGAQNFAMATFDRPGFVLGGVRVTRTGGRVDVASDTVRILRAPPPGEVGVTINDGATYTNDAVVRVNPVWPPYTKRMVFSNDRRFQPSKSFTIGASQDWLLDARGSERLPRRVYVRFNRSDVIHTDDIILDETSPVLAQVKTVTRLRGVELRVKARDNLSGVSRMQVTAKRKRPGKWRRMRRISRVRTNADTLFVRVRDKAGNKSRWRRAR